MKLGECLKQVLNIKKLNTLKTKRIMGGYSLFGW